jgi:tRNA dimethylallyltransferase
MTDLPLVAVVGATASGKSDLAVNLALRLDGEVVNADAMQLYRGMDIGTAKLRLAERRGVPHHLLDVLDVTQAASVAEFQGWARETVADIWSRGRVPVLVGGSGLYVRAAVDRIEFPGTDPRVRARLDAEASRLGPDVLHERLASLDPAAAKAILPSNSRRIVRALEVIEITGRPFSATLPAPEYWHPRTVQVALDVPRAVLDDRVEARVDAMWAAGLVQEVRALLAQGLADGPTASRALGYSQVLRALSGEWSEQQARDRTVSATRRFIRRQDAWFRTDERVQWLDPADGVDGAVAAVAAAAAL